MASSRKYRLLAGIAVMVSAAGAAVALTRPALAVTGIVVVQSDGATPRSQEGGRFTTAFCPQGMHVLGGGADIIGGSQTVHLQRVVPFLGTPGQPDGVTADAFEDNRGTDHDWTMRTTAVCAPASALPGWAFVFGPIVASGPGGQDVSAHVDCPAGTKVIGAGGQAAGFHYLLDDVMPDSDLSGVTAEVMRDDSNQPDTGGSAQASAICADPLPGLQLVTRKTAASTGNKTVSAPCPSGTRVIGAAGALSGALGQAHLDRIGFNSSRSRSDVDARADVDGTSNRWQAWAFAICAR